MSRGNLSKGMYGIRGIRVRNKAGENNFHFRPFFDIIALLRTVKRADGFAVFYINEGRKNEIYIRYDKRVQRALFLSAAVCAVRDSDGGHVSSCHGKNRGRDIL